MSVRIVASAARASIATAPPLGDLHCLGVTSVPASHNDMLEVGNPAPDFTAQTDSGSSLTLSALRGKPVVLYFYPKDDTPG
jgi:cytochrome oxidase Cu insertion factor (SCO1/SenC/PrrC family)